MSRRISTNPRVVIFTAPSPTRRSRVSLVEFERCLREYDRRFECVGWGHDGVAFNTYTLKCATAFDALLLQQYLIKLWPFLFGDAPVEIALGLRIKEQQ